MPEWVLFSPSVRKALDSAGVTGFERWEVTCPPRRVVRSNVDPTGRACFALNSDSAFCQRAAEYGNIDAQLGGKTRFFAAASAISQANANVDVPHLSNLFVSISTQTFLGSVGKNLLTYNRNFASSIEAGGGGENLDSLLVQAEQTLVQQSLDNLKKADAGLYGKVVQEINAVLNPGFRARLVGNLLSTDAAYLRVLDGVRKQLGRDIDFSRQSDREAIGNAVIAHIRKTGGCDVAGEKLTGC